jgi:peptidoglycan/LPS O-acetylase OafA/YrhL
MKNLFAINKSKNYRSDIQYLRGISVLAVVVYHFWPDLLPGGFIGVDVFFVISGFLMTEYLYPLVVKRQKSIFSFFWFRRLRRILPLAFAVSCVSMALSIFIAPYSVQKSNFIDFLGTLSFSVNFIFQNRQVDYLSNDALPSLFQQYWSLAIEEQFYFLFPIALVSLFWLKSSLGIRSNLALTSALVIAWTSSLTFAFSAYITGQNLYFSSFSRFWELLSGALVFLSIKYINNRQIENKQRKIFSGLRLLAWAGLVLSLFLIKPSEIYPGIQALFPVFFSAMIIVLGSNQSEKRFRIFYFLEIAGLLSFGIYLWHWPVLISASYLGLQGNTVKILLFCLTVAISILTFYLIEEPFRKWSPNKNSTKIIALVAVAITVIIALSTSTLVTKSPSGKLANETTGICTGAEVLSNSSCPENYVLNDFEKLSNGIKDLDPNWCLVQPTNDWKTCTYFGGNTEGIALVGDSHAAALIPAMKIAASNNGKYLKTFTRFGCPGITSEFFEASFHDSVYWEQCTEWSKRVLQEIAIDTSIKQVVFAGWFSSYPDQNISEENRLTFAKVSKTLVDLQSQGKQIYVVTDVPDTKSTNIPDCLLSAGKGAIDPCVIQNSVNQNFNVVIDAARSKTFAKIIDLYSFICPQLDRCHSVIGGVPIYADTNHISDSFSKTLGSFFTFSL